MYIIGSVIFFQFQGRCQHNWIIASRIPYAQLFVCFSINSLFYHLCVHLTTLQLQKQYTPGSGCVDLVTLVDTWCEQYMHVLVKIGNTYAPNEFIIKKTNMIQRLIDWKYVRLNYNRSQESLLQSTLSWVASEARMKHDQRTGIHCCDMP